MICTDAYKEHIMYTFHGFCKVVIRNAAITAWRDQQSLDYPLWGLAKTHTERRFSVWRSASAKGFIKDKNESRI